MTSGWHEAESPPDARPQERESTVRVRSDEAEGADRGERRRRHRRVRTEAVPGSDPAPQPEPPRHSTGENDERLRGDVPPHY
jgi:hypothetical protein